MKNAFQSIGADLAAEIVEKLQSAEVRQIADATKAAPDSDSGTFRVIITTENLDRYNEVIKLDGWELEHYRKNPIVLWGHDHNRPIGVATSIDIADGKMIAEGKFAPTDFAQEIRHLYDVGIVRATSVGFIEKEREGNLITKAELIEFSFVSVPANPYALSLAMEKGLGINELVTKGIMFVEKAANDDEPDAHEEAAVEPEQPIDPAPAPEERSFSTKQLAPVIDSLRSALVALEALDTKSEELEGDDTTVVEPEEHLTEEERQYRAFSEKRKLLQDASTVIGEVLAESRRAIEASRAA